MTHDHEKTSNVLISTFTQSDIAITPAKLKQFDCGDTFLNSSARKLQKTAKEHQLKVYVATLDDNLVGYCTTRVGQLMRDDFAGGSYTGMPRLIPVLLLEQIATDIRYQKQGIGSDLLVEAVFHSALKVSMHAGLQGVALWSHPRAVAFYRSLGFITLPTTQSISDGDQAIELSLMYLDIDTIIASLGDG
ncbi:GNAT family N-acetyltransferase [Pokkaliibacter sp. MBI-7]|uniref:GNAT family N-acetyltransferase n=1 Tax=Pokkaliibacter sp. MBI-7 TaxID=3040600 RepID=UPI00244C6DA5|nr:GNAT family N-acetyltransferase [Pokkaliibacter sp. MBI-7]MDH2431049.1 GNAT family N-acetyltransferase [Pokkaliibacter sp. MBI-7]MDH2436744.1 GNAT family N-acetyltransferase [Pokkaliibacter sp. MBI-7]